MIPSLDFARIDAGKGSIHDKGATLRLRVYTPAAGDVDLTADAVDAEARSAPSRRLVLRVAPLRSGPPTPADNAVEASPLTNLQRLWAQLHNEGILR